MNHLVNFYRSMDTKHRHDFILLFFTQLIWSWIVGFMILYTVSIPLFESIDNRLDQFNITGNHSDLILAYVLYFGSIFSIAFVSFIIPYVILKKTKSQKEINQLKLKYKLDHNIKHLF
jgi:uncharacterized membrane protein